MRLLACLLALAVAAQSVRLEPRGASVQYTAGTQYKYDYKALTLSGIPLVSNERTGIAIWTQFTLFFETEDKAALKLYAPELLEIKQVSEPIERIPDLHELEKYGELFFELPSEIKEKLVDYLLKPIQFRLDTTRGLIRDVLAEEGEPEWSLNIKRAILNQFQLQYVDKVQHVFEDNILGEECKVHYDIVRSSEHDTENVRYITKELVPQNCRTLSQFRDTIGMQGVQASAQDDIMRSNYVTKYEVVENNRRFFIRSSVSEGKTTLRPFSPEEGEFVTYTRQELIFKEETKNEMINVMSGRMIKRSDTLFFHLQTLDNEMSDIYAEIMTEDNKVELIKKLLWQIVEKTESEVDPTFEVESTHEFLYVTKLVRSLQQKRSIELLVDYILNNNLREQKVRPLLISTLSFAGSKPIVEYLPTLRTRLTATEFNVIITALPLTHVPTPKTLEILTNLYQQTTDEVTRKQVLLVIGSNIHNLCKPIKLNEETLTFPCEHLSLVEDIKELLTSEYMRADNDWKLIVLKAIGNTGLDLVEFLSQQIKTTTLPEEIRVNAIYALRRVHHEEKIRRVLLPVFRNEMQLYSPELRIAAFNVLIERVPTGEMLNVLVARMETEESLQVGNYIYSYLKNLIEMPTIFTPTKDLTIAAQEHLSTLKRFEDGFWYSKNLKQIITSLSYRMAKLLDMNLINVPTQGLPRSFNLRLIKVVSGYYIELLETGARMQGVDKLIKEYLMQWEQSSEMLQWLLGARFHRDLAQVKSLLKEDIETKQVEETKLYWFVKTMGHELGVFTMKDLTQYTDNYDSMWTWESRIRYFNILPLNQATIKVQSLVGIPVVADVGQVFMLSLHTDKVDDTAVVNRVIVPRVMIRSVVRVGVDLGLFKPTVGQSITVRLAVPLKLKLDWDTESKEFLFELNIDHRNPLMRDNLLEIYSLPVFMTEQIKTQSLTYEVDLVEMEVARLMQEQYEVEMFGLRFYVEMPKPDWTQKLPVYPFNGRHIITMTWTDEPKPLGFKWNLNWETKQLFSVLTLNQLYEEWKYEIESLIKYEEKNNLPTLTLNFAPKWMTEAFNFYFTWEIKEGQINPRFSWLEATEETPIKVEVRAQWGWDKTYSVRDNDIVVKTTLSKSDLQKMFEVEDMLIETSDCYKCENNIEESYRNQFCDRCIFKRSWLSRIESEVFVNLEKVFPIYEMIEPSTIFYSWDYLSYWNTKYLEEDITESLLSDQRSLLTRVMQPIATTDNIYAFKITHDFHPALTEYNVTLEYGMWYIVYPNMPLLPAQRRLYNLPLNRLTDVAVDRILKPKFGQCTFEPMSWLTTFDNNRFQIPKELIKPECERLLVRDFTKGQFEVTSKTMINQLKTLKIKLEDSVIELLPTENGDYEVRINNIVTPFKDDEVVTSLMHVKRVHVQTPSDETEVKLDVILQHKLIKLILFRDLVNVELPFWYRNQVGGLCGDYNGETIREYVLPDQTLARDLTQFVRAYTDRQCL